MIKSQKKTSNDKNKYKRIEVKKKILKCFIVYMNSKTLCNVKKKDIQVMIVFLKKQEKSKSQVIDVTLSNKFA